jgi:hypothetical protein
LQIFFNRQLRQFMTQLGFQRVTMRFSFGQTTGDNPNLRFSARTLRATRTKARSARATKIGAFFAPFTVFGPLRLRVFTEFSDRLLDDAEPD